MVSLLSLLSARAIKYPFEEKAIPLSLNFGPSIYTVDLSMSDHIDILTLKSFTMITFLLSGVHRANVTPLIDSLIAHVHSGFDISLISTIPAL